MNASGPLAKGLAFLMGKQPEEERSPPRLPGAGMGRGEECVRRPIRVRITRVVAGSPAAKRAPGRRCLVLSSGQAVTASRRPVPPWPRSRTANPSS